MNKVLKQIQERRKSLRMTQEDIAKRIGMTRQQYQRLEKHGNPRMDTLELIAKGLKAELLVIPQDKLRVVKEILERDSTQDTSKLSLHETKKPSDDPWDGLLDQDDE